MSMNRADSHRRSQVDPLEPRRLMAGFNANINFQKKGAVPAGYTADIGMKYADQNGMTYGWDKDNGQFMVDRHTEAKLRYDTFAFVGVEGSATRWEIKVPNGLYRVHMMAGDASYTNSNYSFDIEGERFLNRRPNKTTRWRKGEGFVWVSDGRLTVSSSSTGVNNKINSIEIEQVDPHVTGQDIVNPFSNTGMVQNEVPVGYALPLLKDVGTRNVKLWYDVDWNADPNTWDIKNIGKYKRAGYTTTVTFGTNVVPTYDQAKAFFQRLADAPGMTDAVDFWEIGNEPNHPAMWHGSLTEFVQNYMRPAYEVLKPLGEPTIGGGATGSPSVAANLQSVGYSNYCDYSSYHPYGNDGNDVIQRAITAKALFGNKPMIITEWNVVGDANNLDGWADQVAIAAAGLKNIAYMSFYFALETSTTHVGEGGVFDNNLEPNGKFYDVMKSVMA